MIDIVIALLSVAAHDKAKKDRQRRQREDDHRGHRPAGHAPPSGRDQKSPHSK